MSYLNRLAPNRLTLAQAWDDAEKHGKNPVVETLSYRGWTIQRRANGIWDAVNGLAISPGFENLDEATNYVRIKDGRNERNAAQYDPSRDPEFEGGW